MKIVTPPLCARGSVIDYAAIKPSSLVLTRRERVYRPSRNPTYSSSPTAQPNIKNFTNDYLVAPPGSAHSQLIAKVDPHLLTYAADTAHYEHTTSGALLHRTLLPEPDGDRIDGAYIDVDLAQGTQLKRAELDGISYGAAFDTDPAICPDTLANPATPTQLLLRAAYAFGSSSRGATPGRRLTRGPEQLSMTSSSSALAPGGIAAYALPRRVSRCWSSRRGRGPRGEFRRRRAEVR